MPRSYLELDPDFKDFPRNTNVGVRYCRAIDDLEILKRDILCQPDAKRLAKLRTLYIKASNLCTELATEIEKRYQWPPG